MINGFYVTSKGLEYLAQASSGKQMTFTKGVFGKGVPPQSYNPIAATQLLEPLGTMEISKAVTEENEMTITTQFTNIQNEQLLPPFTLTELGIMAKVYTGDIETSPEALVFYAAMKPEEGDGIPADLTEFEINWPLTLAGTENITVKIDESLVYVTKEEYNIGISHKIALEGTGKTLTGTLKDTTLGDQTKLTVKLPANLVEDGATLSVNNSPDYPIKNIDGKPLKKGPIAGAWLNLIYSDSDKCFYILGGGGQGAEAATMEDITEPEPSNEKMVTPLLMTQIIADTDVKIAQKCEETEKKTIAEVQKNLDANYSTDAENLKQFATLVQLPEEYLLRIQATQPAPIAGKKILWIKL